METFALFVGRKKVVVADIVEVAERVVLSVCVFWGCLLVLLPISRGKKKQPPSTYVILCAFRLLRLMLLYLLLGKIIITLLIAVSLAIFPSSLMYVCFFL